MKDSSLPRGVTVDVPGRPPLGLNHLILDFNGTLAKNGKLLPGVKRRLTALAQRLEITILTADTFGTARLALRGIPATIHTVKTGVDKRNFVVVRRRRGVVAIGNGNNDVEMLRRAALGIAVLGPEGIAPALLRHAKVLTASIQDALVLLLEPTRLIATLRR